MKVLCLVLVVGIVGCSAAPGQTGGDDSIELFSGVAIEKWVAIILFQNLSENIYALRPRFWSKYGKKN